MTLHPDQPDYSVPSLGPISKESRLEWRSLMSNDNGIEDDTTPEHFLTAERYKGKFFPRGCRGKIERFEIYCEDGAGDQITLWFSPQPGMGPVDGVIITPGADWGWANAVWRKFWNYDSLFVWVQACGAGASYAYDEEAPYDAHGSDADIAVWPRETRRYFIRVVYDSETAGDVPVSGTINNIEIPSRSDERLYESKVLTSDAEYTIVTVDGAGEVEYIVFLNQAVADSHNLDMRIYCDDNLAWYWSYAALSTWGYIPATPGMSLLKYVADGECVVHLTLKFEFRRQLKITIQRKAGAASMGTFVEGLVNMMR